MPSLFGVKLDNELSKYTRTIFLMCITQPCLGLQHPTMLVGL